MSKVGKIIKYGDEKVPITAMKGTMITVKTKNGPVTFDSQKFKKLTHKYSIKYESDFMQKMDDISKEATQFLIQVLDVDAILLGLTFNAKKRKNGTVRIDSPNVKLSDGTTLKSQISNIEYLWGAMTEEFSKKDLKIEDGAGILKQIVTQLLKFANDTIEALDTGGKKMGPESVRTSY